MSHQRCAEHDLAVGPQGECVLCRRARYVPRAASGRPRWLAPALLAAGLGTTLLGGVALARSRTVVPPVEATTTPEALLAPVTPHVEAAPAVTPVQAEVHPCEPAPTPPPASHPAPPPAPPRDYLGEAYAAMPKGNLYDEAPAQTKHTMASSGSECPCKQGGCQRIITRGVPGQPFHYGPMPATPGMIATPNGPAYAAGGGMTGSHGAPHTSMSPGLGRLR